MFVETRQYDYVKMPNWDLTRLPSYFNYIFKKCQLIRLPDYYFKKLYDDYVTKNVKGHAKLICSHFK